MKLRLVTFSLIHSSVLAIMIANLMIVDFCFFVFKSKSKKKNMDNILFTQIKVFHHDRYVAVQMVINEESP